LNRQAGWLYLIALAMNSATGVLVIAVPLYAIRLGANALELGFLGMIGALAYTLACPLTGRYSDRSVAGDSRRMVGRRRSVVFCCSLLLFVDCGIFFVDNLGELYLLSITAYFCAAFFWPPIQAWIAELREASSLSKTLGNFNTAWSIGITIGPVIGGYLFAWDYRLPWCYAAAINLFILLVIFNNVRGEEEVGSGETPSEIVLDKKNRIYLPLALWANFVCWFSLSNVQSIYPKLAVEVGFSPPLIGFFLFLIGGTQTVFFVLLGRSSFWHYRIVPLVGAHAVAAVGMLCVYMTAAVPVLTIAFASLGVGLALSYFSSIYYSVAGVLQKGKRTGIHEFIVGSGFLLGPLAGGICAQYIALGAPFLICAALLGLTACAEAVIVRRFSAA
jgi:MFS family permease